MTTAVIEQLPAERVDTITTQARQVRFGRTVATLLAGVLYALGYGTAKVLGAVWLALVWCAMAVALGWREARHARGREHA